MGLSVARRECYFNQRKPKYSSPGFKNARAMLVNDKRRKIEQQGKRLARITNDKGKKKGGVKRSDGRTFLEGSSKGQYHLLQEHLKHFEKPSHNRINGNLTAMILVC